MIGYYYNVVEIILLIISIQNYNWNFVFHYGKP